MNENDPGVPLFDEEEQLKEGPHPRGRVFTDKDFPPPRPMSHEEVLAIVDTRKP